MVFLKILYVYVIIYYSALCAIKLCLYVLRRSFYGGQLTIVKAPLLPPNLSSEANAANHMGFRGRCPELLGGDDGRFNFPMVSFTPPRLYYADRVLTSPRQVPLSTAIGIEISQGPASTPTRSSSVQAP